MTAGLVNAPVPNNNDDDDELFSHVTPELILASTKKLMAIQRGEAEFDDRDSLANQTFHGPEDFFAERIEKDAGGVLKNALWKATNLGSLQRMQPSLLTPAMRSVLIGSGLGAPIEEINPIDVHDQLLKVVRTGEGAMQSMDAVPDEARTVHPSQLGFIDLVRTPESEKIGIDNRVTTHTYKGSDNQIYSDFVNVRTGKNERVSAPNASVSVIAFPGEMLSGNPKVRALVKGKLSYVDRRLVDYELPHPADMLNMNVGLIPMANATQGNRLLMAGKMFNQALPLRTPEAPWVQSESFIPGKSYEELMARKVGAVVNEKPGTIVISKKNSIVVKHDDGTTKEYPMYHNFPFNRKTFLHTTPVVSPGMRVGEGQVLARSNYTDDKGTTALGTNLRTAFMPYKGLTFEDAYVISESAAKKLSSEHMYTPSLDFNDDTVSNRNKFISLFPSKYNNEKIKDIDENGVIKVGTVVKKGDPIILAVGKMEQKAEGQWSQLVKSAKSAMRDKSVEWDHDEDGIITDVYHDPKKGVQVAVKSYNTMRDGDKISGRYGDKGTVVVVADDKMPKDAQGRPIELIQNPLTLPSRMNPAQIIEIALGKVARKTGKAYKMPMFNHNNVDFAMEELKKNGLSDTEDLDDPETGNKFKKIFTGEKFVMKLHHSAEGKEGVRSFGSYTAEELPATGGHDGAKTIANLALNALVSHGATDVIRDSKVIRGQKNDEYWQAFRQGFPPPSPKVPLVYNKFMSHLVGAGINIKKQGDTLNLMALTDKDIDTYSRGEVTSYETVDQNTLDPQKGGLFDRGVTGGHGGRNWSHITLPEPMPNPVMEDPIRRILGLTQKKYESILAGNEELNGFKGGEGIRQLLARVNVNDEIERNKQVLKTTSSPSVRDDATKRLRYLTTLKTTGIKPSELVLTKVPVLPPIFRPISKMAGGTSLVSDANHLYVDLMQNIKAFKDLKPELGANGVNNERLAIYNAFKAVTGLGDPVQPKLKQQGVSGLLKQVFGTGSPKLGMFQKRVIGMQVDETGRGVITPNPSLGMDQVGLPESQAWEVYKPFIIRRLTRSGTAATQAAKMVENKDPSALKALMDEMAVRPIITTRAPALHRYNIMAHYPKLIKGHTIQVSPLIVSGYTADFDGDTMSFHVPVSEEAVKQAKEKMLPSKNSIYVADFKAHYSPKNEYLLGLWQATKEPSKQTRVFRSKEDAMRAYKAGAVNINDNIIIGT